MLEEYYLKLGLPNGSSKEEVKRAYRQLVKRVHPDINPSENAHKQFIELTEAYEILMGERKSPFKELEDIFNPAPTDPSKRKRNPRSHQANFAQRHKRFEQEKMKREAMETMVNIYNYISPVLMVFAFIIMLDVQLEERIVEDRISWVQPDFYRADRFIIHFANNPSIVVVDFVGEKFIDQKAKITTTAIFRINKGFWASNSSGQTQFFNVRNNVIFLIRFFSFLAFGLGIFYYYTKRTIVKFNLFIYYFFASFFLIVFLFFHGN